MNSVKEIVFKGLEVSKLEEPIRFELFEGVEFVNEPAHDEGKALDLANELIRQVDISHLFIVLLKVLYKICILITLLNEIILQFLGTLFENIDDFDLVVESFLSLFGLNVSLINFAKLFPEDLAHDGDWVVILLGKNLFLD